MRNLDPSKNDPFGILEGPATEDFDAPGGEEEDLLSDLYYRFEQAEEQRRYHESDWEYNRLMLIGEQFIVKRSYDTQVLRAIDSEDALRRYTVDNELRVASRAFVGKMTRMIPGVAVLPASGDREDLLGAEVRESYLNWFFDQKEMRKKYKRAMENFPWNGTSIFELCWKDNCGRDLAWCEQCEHTSEALKDGEPCPQCMAEAEMKLMQARMAQAQAAQMGIEMDVSMQIEVPGMLKIKEGELDCVLHDTRNFFPEPGVAEIEDMSWCYTKVATHLSKIRQMFPERGMLIGPELGIYDDRWVSYTGSLINAEIQTHYLQDHVNLYKYFEIPSGKHPNGRIIFAANGRILDVKENYYYEPLGRLPFYAARSDLRPGEFWGEAHISQQSHLQKDLNHLLSQRRDYRSMTLNPRVIVDRGSGVSKDDFTATRPGHVILKNRNTNDPRYMELQPLPNYTYNESEEYRRAIRLKQGVTDMEVGLGQQATSGRAYAFATSQAQELVSPYIIENVSEWLKMARGILTLAEMLENPDKRWAISGEDSYMVHSWSMIENSRHGWNVYLSDEDSLSQNPAMRMQEAMELLQIGAFTDPTTGIPDMKLFYRMAGLKMPGAGIDLKTNEYNYAAQIPERMARGEEIIPQPEDDAKIISEELAMWLKTRGRNADPALTDAVRQLWMVYAQAMVPTSPADVAAMPNPNMVQMAAGAGQQAPQSGVSPQGTPARPQGPDTMGLGAGATPQGGIDAAQLIQQADNAGEFMARGSQPHEG